jgi:hypothetical protein
MTKAAAGLPVAVFSCLIPPPLRFPSDAAYPPPQERLRGAEGHFTVSPDASMLRLAQYLHHKILILTKLAGDMSINQWKSRLGNNRFA